MDSTRMPIFEASSSGGDQSRNLNHNHQVNGSNSIDICFDDRSEQSLIKFSSILDNSSDPSYQTPQFKMNMDSRAMLNNLDFLEQKIHQLQDIVRSTLKNEGTISTQSHEFAAQQKLINTDLTSIIIQLISTAGTLLSPMKNVLANGVSSVEQIGSIPDSASNLGLVGTSQQKLDLVSEGTELSEYEELIKGLGDWEDEEIKSMPADDNDVKDSGENLPPGSYEVLQLEKEEILAPHTHFCSICGKGFKRDANLRMHMRGHGDEYKSPSALSKPQKEASSEPVLLKRYSCPFVGCKRNREHKNFQPLKTILCVKNHYKRSHCDKRYICRKCNNKKFSVMADLKTHEKHCGRDKWLCSCGTTFSRKDKLFGHIALFQGHTPALPMDEIKGQGTSDHGHSHEETTKMEDANNIFSDNAIGVTNVSDFESAEDDYGFFSMNVDSFNFGGIDGFQ